MHPAYRPRKSLPPMSYPQGLAPPRATDPGWAHGTMVNGGRQKIKCKYCHKIILGGGISRLKQHLAGERGNVVPCEQVPEEVKVQMQQHLGFKVLEKLKRQKGSESSKKPYISYFQGSEEEEEEDGVGQIQKAASAQYSTSRRGKVVLEGASSRTKRRKKQNPSSATHFVTPPMHQNFASQESIEHADLAVARFMYDAGIPFTAANSCYFQKMADAIAAVGPGYKMPSYHSLRGKLLNRSVQDAGEYSKELRKSWEVTGCSVLADRWMDVTGRTVINFLIYCPKGTTFLKSVDASDLTNSVEGLLDLFDTVVEEVGVKNIVNFVTDISPDYKTAGKLLMEKYKTFFCSTCGAQCISFMLEEFEKIKDVKDVLGKAKKVTQLAYNNAWILTLIRKKAGEKEIIQLASRRFASIFLSLQNILSMKDNLHYTFTSAYWLQSSLSKQRVGLEVAEIIVDPWFWSNCDKILKIVEPLLSVLHLMDSEERPSVGHIYNAMEKAKQSIIRTFNNSESEFLPYLKIIDDIWQEEFQSPLHAAACYLNPSVFYDPSFSFNKVIHKGLLDCIETLEPDLSAQVTITSHIKFYEEAAGDFGRPVALRGRESLAPATWWSLYASDYPHLQRLAVRVLSQTCSITPCKRNWSTFERIYSKTRNRLEHQRLNDLIFVHYNLHLQERQADTAKVRCARETCDPICLEAADAGIGDWVEDFRADTEDEHPSSLGVMAPGDRNLLSQEMLNSDDSNCSTDDRSSDVTKGIDDNDDL
ncbi:uncharacterized protein LOC119988871 isoform X2 [Tripterygium wilfordii]|uniref:uncharacterized protein LOC119988871 isoform X2 n=1 Tax=Tripterygium wilfordii TaxID=458696 RepID=UPI0018F7E738|nr:uncharacterized protein LOC119988871 isoform X2 [Tripterygium wilfordii]